MAQQLEAALRRAPAPEGRPPVTDPLAAATARGSSGQNRRHDARAPARDMKARVEPKFEPKPEPQFEPKAEPKFDMKPSRVNRQQRPARISTKIWKRRWPACSAVRQERRDSHFRPPCSSCDGGGRGSRGPPRDGASRRAGHQRQFRTGQRADRARDPDDRAADGAVAGAVDPRHDDVVHAHRGGAVAAAHRARHRDRAAQRGDRLARAVPDRLRDGPGAATRLRHRHQAADRQRDHRRAGLRARLAAAARLHAEERAREGPQAVRRHVQGSRRRQSPRICRCACWCRPS